MTTPEAEDRGRALKLTPVSRETEVRFALLLDELKRWQAVHNLVGISTLEQAWTRHIADSAQLFPMTAASRWLDLGSGGGFPGLVIGILLAERGQGGVELIESNERKCAFLRQAARVTGARAHVRRGRIEDVIGDYTGLVDVVTARGLAPLCQLLDWSKDLLRTGAIGVFPKGQDVGVELTEASRSWKVDADLRPSLTDPRGRIVIVRGLEARHP